MLPIMYTVHSLIELFKNLTAYQVQRIASLHVTLIFRETRKACVCVFLQS